LEEKTFEDELPIDDFRLTIEKELVGG